MEKRVFTKQNPLFASLSCCWCVVSDIVVSSFKTTYCECDVREMQIPAERILPPFFPHKHDGLTHLLFRSNFLFPLRARKCVSHLLVLEDL